MRCRVAVLLVIVLGGVVACADGDEVAEPPGAAAYASVIERFLPTSIDPEELPVVFVVPVNGEALSLADQVAVIDALSDVGDVRFVDDVGAAVDEESSDQPPRDEGMLVGLGRFSADAPYTVRVELYRDVDQVDGRLLTVRNDRGNWIVVDSQPVAPEVLVAGG